MHNSRQHTQGIYMYKLGEREILIHSTKTTKKTKLSADIM